MQYVIHGYEPTGLFRYFEEICAIPHSSGNEGGVADYLAAFALEHGLQVQRDALDNVTIYKPASPGCEKAPALILQAHTDMVCVKAPGAAHDFNRDGLRLKVEDGFLRAEGTSLGADDGIGVALILQLLSDDTLRHPALECLFTTQEETGMDGVRGIDISGLRGRMLLNLDGSEEALIIAGSAGGTGMLLSRPIHEQPARGCALAITVSGLLSGHSGEDIHRGRANAIKLMARILHRLSSAGSLHIASLDGGDKSNAIPACCGATVIFPGDSARKHAIGLLHEAGADFIDEYGPLEPAMSIGCQPLDCLPEHMFDGRDSQDIIDFLYVLPAGIFSRNPLLDDVVVSSNNLATVSLADGTAHICCMGRAACPSLQREGRERLEILCRRFGFTLSVDNEYGSWAFASQSPLRELYAACSAEVLGAPAKPVILHAGLESAFFTERIPGLDVITVGPDVSGLHSTQERMSLESCGRVWRILRLVIEKLAECQTN